MHAELTASPNTAPAFPADKWDPSYEWRSILLLSLGFALVGFDRYLILPMFPAIMSDLQLTYKDLGNITGALAITWGMAAFVAGRVADRFGRRKTLAVSMVTFSLLVGFSGLAAGAASLILIRALMGFAEGAYSSPSLVATMEAAKPSRKGMTVGFQQTASSLLGLAIAPILVTQLMQYVDWRYIFLIAAPPGLIIAFLLARTIREPARETVTSGSGEVDAGKLKDLFRYRNVVLAAIAMLVWLNAIIVLTAFLPSYLMDYLKLPVPTMGYVMSSVGFGAVLGSGIIPGLSDKLGRKPCMIFSVLAASAALYMMAQTGADATALFLWLMTASAFLSGMISITVGPLAIESVPVNLRGTSSGVVIAVGEIFGGGISPVIAGFMAHNYGIGSIFHLSIGGLAVGLVACLLLRESAPSRIAQH